MALWGEATTMHPANCLGFGFLFNGRALMMTLSLNGNLLFREIHIFWQMNQIKARREKKLLQPSNHSTPTINIAGAMMGKFAFQGCIAAFLLFSLAQGMCNKLSSPVQWSVTWFVLLSSTATVLFSDPKDVTVEANHRAQFNCTASCGYVVSWYMAGYTKAIKRNNTVHC